MSAGVLPWSSCTRTPICALLFGMFTACGDSSAGESARDIPAEPCGIPRLAAAEAVPFDWIAVEDLPAGFHPVAAEVSTPGLETTLVAPVYASPEGTVEVRVPVHPSFRIAGGDVSIRIYAGPERSCEPVPLTIAPLPPAPGAMAEAVVALRAALDEVARPRGAEPRSAVASRADRLSIFAVPALWALPALEELERLWAWNASVGSSAADAEMLDALAARLELADRMRHFHGVVVATRELVGELLVPGPESLAVGELPIPAAGVRPARGFRAHLAAAIVPAPLLASSAPQAGSGCPGERSNLFAIDEPAKLDNLMRAQDYAQRFLAGANDQAGASASGTVFGDLGVLMGVIGMLGKQGEVVGKVWEAFSTVVLNTTEAYASLLPGDMKLVVQAAPATFEEDSEAIGRWTARATATSQGMKLTDQVIEKVMEKALEMGMADVSIGKPLKEQVGASIPDDVLDETTGKAATFWNDVGDRAASQGDKKLLEEPTRREVKDLLKALGATEGPDGAFDIPGGCWTLPDMSAPSPGADPGAPPLVTAHLSGDAVEFVEDGSDAPRTYRAARAGTSRLEVRTAEGYRKSFESVGTTYAFGGTQYTAVTRIQVLEIEVDLYPSIIAIEAGEPVPFAAVVRNALDTRLRWVPGAGRLTEIVDNGDGSHEATLVSPTDPKAYPIRIEAISLSSSGPRGRAGAPERKAVAIVQLRDAVIEIQPPGGCVSAGEERQFGAQVLGAENQEVTWSVRGGGGGRIGPDGLFRAGAGSGTQRIRATWVEDDDVTAEVDVTVGGACSYWTASIGLGRFAGEYAGSGGEAIVGPDRIRLNLTSEPDARPLVLVTFSIPRSATDQPVTVEMCGVEVAFSPTGNFVEDVQAARAANVCSGGTEPPIPEARDRDPNYSWAYPAPARVSVRVLDDWVEGWAEGTFFRGQPYPPDPSEQGPVRIEFRIPTCDPGPC